MLVLITNSIVPYCFDAARVIGLPEGSLSRFRYSRKWLDSSLSLEKVVGEPLLIVLRAFESGSFHPLRFATMVGVDQLGDIVRFVFAVGKYPNQSVRNAWLDQVTALHLAPPSKTNTPGQQMAPLVFTVGDGSLVPSPKQLPDEQMRLWNDISHTMGDLRAFQHHSFFKLLSIKTVAGKECPLTSAYPEPQTAFLTRPNTFYLVEVLQKCPWEMATSEHLESPFLVQLTSADSDLEVRRNSQPVVGKYDVLSFAIHTPDTKIHRYIPLDFQTKGGQDPDSHSPFLSVLLKIRPGGWHYFVTGTKLVGGLAGIALMALAKTLSEHTGLSESTYQAISLTLVLLAAGKWDKVAEEAIGMVKDLRS